MGIVLLIIFAFLMIVDLNTLELTSTQRILGPGAFPLIIFGASILLDIWMMIEIATGKGGSAKVGSHIDSTKMFKAIRLWFVIVLTMALMTVVGYVLALMAFTFCEMKFMSEKKVKLYIVIIATFLLPLCIYFVFNALGVSLPSPSWMPF